MELFGDFDLFEDGTVLTDLKSTTKTEALRELISRAKVFDSITEREDFERSVLSRESLQSTGMGHGVAIAHGKSNNIDKIKVALGISRTGIEYDSIDGEPVYFLFLIANPPGKQMEYLMTLSALVRLVRNEIFRNELLACTICEEIQRKLMNNLRLIMARQGQPQHA